MYVLYCSQSLQPQLGSDAFEISDQMVHVLITERSRFESIKLSLDCLYAGFKDTSYFILWWLPKTFDKICTCAVKVEALLVGGDAGKMERIIQYSYRQIV